MSKKDKSKSEAIKKGKEIQSQPIDQYTLDMSTMLPKGNAVLDINYALAVVGENGLAEAGVTDPGIPSTNRSVAIAGNNGTAKAGQWGVAFAGEKGKAIVGANTVAVVSKGGIAEGGDGAVAVVLGNLDGKEKAKIRDNGVAFSKVGGIAEVRRDAVAISFVNGKTQACCDSIMIIKDKNGQFHIGIIGSSKITVTRDLKQDTLYKLDANGEFVED